MTNKYKAQLVLMDGKSKIQQQVTHPENVQVVTPEWLESYTGNNWQAQRLIITDETGKEIATYPQIPNITYKIDLADVRKWVDSGRSESVELEVEYDTASAILSEPIINPLLTNNTVKMVFETTEGKWLREAAELLSDGDELEIYMRMPSINIADKQHPTNWDALRDKWINDAALFDIRNKDLAKRIFNWFKNNVK